MKKLVFLFVALFALALVSCVTFNSSFQNNDDIKIGGPLQVSGNKSYFIVVGEDVGYVKNAQTFYLVKDEQYPDVWNTLVSSVGKVIFVHGTVVETRGMSDKTVAVDKISFPNP